MKKKKPLSLILSVLALSSCGTRLPPPPAHDQGTLIEREDGSFYGYWAPYYSGTPYREEGIAPFIKKNPVCVSADDYAKLKKYSEDVLAIVKSKCPKLVK